VIQPHYCCLVKVACSCFVCHIFATPKVPLLGCIYCHLRQDKLPVCDKLLSWQVVVMVASSVDDPLLMVFLGLLIETG